MTTLPWGCLGHAEFTFLSHIPQNHERRRCTGHTRATCVPTHVHVDLPADAAGPELAVPASLGAASLSSLLGLSSLPKGARGCQQITSTAPGTQHTEHLCSRHSTEHVLAQNLHYPKASFANLNPRPRGQWTSVL